MCTRSREARLRDEPSTAENSGAGKQTRHEMQGSHHREKERKHKEAMGSSQEGEIERGNTLKLWEDQQIGRETDRHEERNTYKRGKEKLQSPRDGKTNLCALFSNLLSQFNIIYILPPPLFQSTPLACHIQSAGSLKETTKKTFIKRSSTLRILSIKVSTVKFRPSACKTGLRDRKDNTTLFLTAKFRSISTYLNPR